VKDWELHHGAKPVGAPALRHFGGIRATGAAAGLVGKFTATPEEVPPCLCRLTSHYL